jgi:hypothetical protein
MIDNPILKRREDGSLKQYEIRICSNKDKYNLSWDQVSEVLNKERGESWGESKYRKWWYAFQDGLEFSKQQNITSNEILNELELKKIELNEERKKLQTINIEYNKISREKSRRDLLFEYVSEKIEEVGSLPSPIFKPLELNSSKKAGILGFGDEHFGKEFVSENNEYNEQIYLERMNKLLYETIDIIKKEHLDELTVLNGADSVEGMALRVSQLTTLQYGFVDQVIKYARYKTEWLKELSKYVKVRYIHVPSANHTELRLHNTSRSEMPKEDVERIIAVYIHDMLKDNERIDVPLYDEGIVDFELLEFNIAACHGHQLKGKKNAVRDISMLKRKFFDFLYVSHFHHGNTLTVGETDTHDIEIIQLPSIIGSDGYSDSLMTGAKSGANLSIYESNKGRTVSYKFILN